MTLIVLPFLNILFDRFRIEYGRSPDSQPVQRAWKRTCTDRQQGGKGHREGKTEC